MIQNGYGGANGSGYLADIHFHAFGPVCETSFINFSGHCVLLDTEGNKIPATWQNATVHVSPPPEWTPMDSSTTAYLWGIWGTNSSDVFAVGWDGAILHYNGSVWTPMESGTGNGPSGVREWE